MDPIIQDELAFLDHMRAAGVSGDTRSNLLERMGFRPYVKANVNFARRNMQAKLVANGTLGLGALNCEEGAWEVTNDGANTWPVEAGIFDNTYRPVENFTPQTWSEAQLLENGWTPVKKFAITWAQKWDKEATTLVTLEGERLIRRGDWLVVGPLNEYYPVEVEKWVYVPAQ